MSDESDFFFDTSEADGAGGVAVGAAPIETGAGDEMYARPITEPKRKRAVAQFLPKNSKKTAVPLFFDLETIPDESRLHLFGLDPVPPVPPETDLSMLPKVEEVIAGTAEQVGKLLSQFVCPESYLDSVAAAEKKGKDRSTVYPAIEKSRGKRGNAIKAIEDRRKLLSTTPEYCRIVAMGWAYGKNEIGSCVVGQEMDLFNHGKPIIVSEHDLLMAFWRLAENSNPLVAYNGLFFDLPVILVRSAMLGVAPTRRIDPKPWGGDFVDPYAIRFPKGAGEGRPGKLKALAPLYGIDVPAGDCDGSQVEELFKTDPAKVGEYVRSDVEVLRAYYLALEGYYW